VTVARAFRDEAGSLQVGSVIATMEYDGLGRLACLCEFGHQGLAHDDEFALIYNRHRYLSPSLGSFIQRDPAGYVDGMDLYEYMGSNPSDYADSTGLSCEYGPHIEFGRGPKVPLFFGNSYGYVELDVRLGVLPGWLYTYFVNARPDRPDYVILRGNLLKALRRMPSASGGMGLIEFAQHVRNVIHGEARQMLKKHVDCDQCATFGDVLSHQVTAPLSRSWLGARLALQTFTVEASVFCRVGPKACCVRDSACSDGLGSRMEYDCDIHWTLYDLYDFKWSNPAGWVPDARTFEIFGLWTQRVSDVATSCDNK